MKVNPGKPQMTINDKTTRAQWMESARKRLSESQQLATELQGKWQFMTNQERADGLNLVEAKLHDCIIMVKGRTVFKNGD